MEVCEYVNALDGEQRLGNWMQTYTGRRFFPIDPRPEEVFIEDIAHALSLACRYGGHCLEFYSVAEHSVLCSYVVPEEDRFAALMHDATEAYVADVIRPLKPYLTGYAQIEHNVWVAIATRFNIPLVLPKSVKIADNSVLLREQIAIMAPAPEPWNVPGEPADVEVMGWTPIVAEVNFLERFHELYKGT